jgi:hypothetical protein
MVLRDFGGVLVVPDEPEGDGEDQQQHDPD